MAKTYRSVRVSKEAYDNFLIKKSKMEREAKLKFKTPIQIPITNIITAVSKEPFFVYDNDFMKMEKKRKKRYVKI